MSFLRRAVQLGVLALVVAQLASLAQSIHPVFDALSQFRLQFTVLLSVGLFALLVMRSWRTASITALSVVAGFFAIWPAISHATLIAPQGRVFTLVQFNTLYKNPTPLAIIEQIRAVKADAVTLQEAAPHNTAIILAKLKAEYPHQLYCSEDGVAVLSRWHAIAEGCEPKKGFGWLRLDVDGEEVTVASIHLPWPWPFEQAKGVTDLEPVFRALPQPLILAGDFNSAPWTHTLARVTEMTSTSLAQGLRLTLKLDAVDLPPWPFLSIDHVLLPKGATAEVRVGEHAGSDHLPLIARILLP